MFVIEGNPGAFRHDEAAHWNAAEVYAEVKDIADVDRESIAEITFSAYDGGPGMAQVSIELTAYDARALRDSLTDLIEEYD